MKDAFREEYNKVCTPSYSARGGFTLIEMLISVTILSIITGIGILNLTSYKNRHSFQLDSTNILEGIRSAQNKAILGEGGTAWGIKFNPSTGSESDTYQIFSGTTYATSSVVTTQTLSRASKFSNPSTGFSKVIIFSKTTGVPDVAQTVGIQTASGGDANIISVSKSSSVSQLSGKDLVGYWALDEEIGVSAYDASGKGSTGTINGSPVWQTVSGCKTGGCLSFNGTTDYITAAVAFNFTGAFSIATWAKTSIGPSAAYRTVISKFSSSPYNGWFLRRNAGASFLSLTFYNNGASTIGINGPAMIVDTWNYYVCTFNGTTANLFVDGVLVGSSTGAAAGVSSGSFSIGGNYGGPSETWKGSIDDVRVYNRALATSEVKALYESY